MVLTEKLHSKFRKEWRKFFKGGKKIILNYFKFLRHRIICHTRINRTRIICGKNSLKKLMSPLVPEQAWRIGCVNDLSLYIKYDFYLPYQHYFCPSERTTIAGLCIKGSMDKLLTFYPKCTAISGRQSAPAIPSVLSSQFPVVPCSRFCGRSLRDASEKSHDPTVRDS